MNDNTVGGLTTRAVGDLRAAGLVVDDHLVSRFFASLAAKRFVILTGLSGSGKTKLAQSAAIWLSSPGGQRRVRFQAGDRIPSDRLSYYVHDVDRLSAELWNHDDPAQAVRVLLPWTLIDQWIDVIQRHGFDASTKTRTIRDIVAAEYPQYSRQQNSFESQLKAAALAVISRGRASGSGDQYLIVPIGADWTSNEQVLGYADALHPGRYVRTPILDLVLRATADANRPYFLILDEMNLSHVERYFADFLSAMESGEPIQLHSGGSGSPLDDVPAALTLPDNLFVIGTVNVDETTYMFSPKVLDRANTIEFRVDSSQIAALLEQPHGIDLGTLAGRGTDFASAFLALARSPLPLAEADRALVRDEIALLFNVMAAFGNEFAFRTTHEMVRFIEAERRLLGDAFSLQAAFDAQVAQKLLPRLNGSRSQLEPILIALGVVCQRPDDFWDLPPSERASSRDACLDTALAAAHQLDASVFEAPAENAPFYSLSFDKLHRMHERLQRNGFTSFAEG